MANKTLYVGTGTGIVSISLLLVFLLQSSDFSVQLSGDIRCRGNCINPDTSDCIGYFNITSINKNYSIRNKGNLNLPFTEPEKVKSFQVYKKGSTGKWSKVNLSKTQTYKAGTKNQYKLNLCKVNPKDNIKWGIVDKSIGINEDPVFQGTNSTAVAVTVYDHYTKYYNTTFCADFPINLSCVNIPIGEESVEFVAGVYIDYINATPVIG